MVGLGALLTILLGAMTLAYLWPNEPRDARVPVGKLFELKRTMRETELPIYVEEGNFFIVPYEPRPDDPYAAAGVAKDGVMVLSARSPHLDRDRVIFCASSGWFESFPDGSKFNPAGERMPGSPAPAGLWRHPFDVSEHGDVLVDARRYLAQPPLFRDTVRSAPAGPNCSHPPAAGGIARS